MFTNNLTNISPHQARYPSGSLVVDIWGGLWWDTTATTRHEAREAAQPTP